MAHQPSIILLVKNKKTEAKALRIELRAAKRELKVLENGITMLNRQIKVQTKAVAHLEARLEEVKHVPTKRQVLAVAAPGSLGPATPAARPF